MCQQLQIDNNQKNSASDNMKMKPSYSIKKVLKTLFKKQRNQHHHHHHHHHQCQHQQQQHLQINKLSNSVEFLESLENMRNSQMEEQYYEEIIENSANEKLDNMAASGEQDIYVPVRYARTEAGTFFWTTNLQPVTSTIVPTADEDLLQPAYCYSNYQYPHIQYQQDRWAQA